MTYLFKLSRRAAAALPAVALVLTVLACSEAAPREFLSPDPGGPPTSSTAPVALVVVGTPSVLPYDQTYLFQAWGRLASGDSVPVAVNWVASAGQISPDGRYRGTVPGSHTVTAYAVASPSLSATSRVEVSNPGPLFATLEVQPQPVYISGGAHVLFGATARLQSGANTVPTVTWRATGGGTIAPNGEFAAGLEPGAYSVIATTLDGMLSDTALVVIGEAALTALQLQPKVITLPGGASQDFQISAAWTDGTDAVPTLEWETGAGTVEMVTGAPGGPQATPGNAQSARFTASTEPGNYKVVVKHRASGKSDTASVTITPVLTAVEVSPAAVNLLPGATAAFAATGRMSDGVQTTVSVSWAATGGTISGSGVYTAGGTPGTYRVIGRLASGTLADTSVVQISAPAAATLTGLTIAPASGTAPVGGTVNFSAAATWSDGSTALPTLTWTAQGGTITPQGQWTAPATAGTYRVIVRHSGGTVADTANYSVVVPPPAVTDLSVSPKAPGVQGGQEVEFQAQAIWSDGSTAQPALTWTATGGELGQGGRWRAPNVSGVYRVVARVDAAGVADTAVVTVVETPWVTTVRVSPRLGSLNPGGTLQLGSEFTWSDGQTREVSRTWTATGGSVSMSGLFTAGSLAGQFMVIASCVGCTVSDTAHFSVTEPVVPAPTVTQLVLNPATVTVAAGASQSFQVAAAWSDGSTTVPPLAWTAAGGSMSGLTYTAGTTAGTYTVIVRDAGGTKADTSVVTITAGGTTPPPPPPGPLALQSITVTPSAASIETGGTLQFAATGTWSDGSTSVLTPSWTATGGTISSDGLYTAGGTTGSFQVTATDGATGLTSQQAVNVTVPQAWNAVEPELPRVTVDVSYPTLAGNKINVGAGGNLQSAINGATCGDEILLAAGATFVGNFTLPAKSCSGWIVIRTNTTLPPLRTRVTPQAAGGFAKILTNNTAPALAVALSAGHYRVVGIEMGAQTSVTAAYNLVSLPGNAAGQLSQMPHDIIFDRVYVHGHATLGFQRCIHLDGVRVAVIDSYISECHGKGFDSQAILVYASPGPAAILNNYLEGAAENVMLGGATPGIAGVIPSDIVIQGNHFFKPVAWKGVWTVKNLFEIKSGRRVLVEGNVFENNWTDGQSGDAIALKSADGGGNAPWTETSDVLLRYNLIRNSPRGFNVAAAPAPNPVVPASRIKFEHNLFENIGAFNGTTGSYLGLILGNGPGLKDVQIVHNTGVTNVSTSLFSLAGNLNGERLVIQDNHFVLGAYGIKGSGTGSGSSALNAFYRDYDMRGNALVGAANLASGYPSGNVFVSAGQSVSGLHGLDGLAPGANTAEVQRQTALALSGNR